MRRKSLLYMTQADPHNIASGASPLTLGGLRSYLMFYAMFFDRLMVGDSQLLNNVNLRALMWPDEPAAKSDVLSDLALFLDHGILFPAIRDSAGSLHDVWRGLTDRSVPGVGSEDYVNFAQQHLGSGRTEVYRASVVSALFRDQVLAIFSSDNEQLKKKLKRSVRQAVYDYVADQDTLYYARLREWLKLEVEKGRIEEYHRRKIDRAVAIAYGHNVPQAVDGSQVDIPLDPKKFWTPIDIRLGRKSGSGSMAAQHSALSVRPFAVSPYVLRRLPAQTVLAIRSDPARRAIMKDLDVFQRTGGSNTEHVAGHLEDFLYSAEQIAFADACGELRDLIRRRRRERRHSDVIITRDVGLAVLGLNIFGWVGSVAGYVGLAVTAWASVQALRHYDERFRHGYAIGRTIPPAHHLLLDHPRRDG